MTRFGHSGKRRGGQRGPEGRQGPPGAGVINWRGPWNEAASYNPNDAVAIEGTAYIATAATVAKPPGDGWSTLARRGSNGPQGTKGERGDKGDRGERGPEGKQGITGPAGKQGPTGAQGRQGLQGEPGDRGYTGPIGMTWCGKWDATQTYKVNDAIEFDGASYICVRESINSPPPSNYWNVVAHRGCRGLQGSQGQQGDKGDRGDQGLQGLQGIEGPQGIPGPQGLQGVPGPEGRQGDPGPQGVRGPQGTGITWRGEWKPNTAYQILDAVSFQGSAYIATIANTSQPGEGWEIFAAKGSQGDIGTPGLDAVAAGGRLTVVSGEPCGTGRSDTLYYTPYVSNQISLYDGGWKLKTFAELSYPLGGKSYEKPYDVFVFDNNGLTLDLVPWNRLNERAIPVVRQDGILVRSDLTTHRYLGTILLSDVGVAEDTADSRLLYNAANKITRPLVPGSLVVGQLDSVAILNVPADTVVGVNHVDSNGFIVL